MDPHIGLVSGEKRTPLSLYPGTLRMQERGGGGSTSSKTCKGPKRNCPALTEFLDMQIRTGFRSRVLEAKALCVGKALGHGQFCSGEEERAAAGAVSSPRVGTVGGEGHLSGCRDSHVKLFLPGAVTNHHLRYIR